MGGECMRLIDVPAYFDGLQHIFDRAHARVPLSQEKQRKLFAQVLSACAENHGHVYRRYLRYLISRRPKLGKAAFKFQRTFLKKVSRNVDKNDASDMARKFGLIYAGGRMGIESGVLPWKTSELFDAIRKCYEGARALLLDDELLLRVGRKKLRSHLISLPKLDELKKSELTELAGFVERQENCYKCVLRAEAFGRIFTSRHQQRLVLAAMIQEGKITLANRRGHQEPRPQEQFVWPNAKRVRSYEILWPRDEERSRKRRSPRSPEVRKAVSAP